MIYLSNKIPYLFSFLLVPISSWLPRQQASSPIVVMLLECISLCIIGTQ